MGENSFSLSDRIARRYSERKQETGDLGTSKDNLAVESFVSDNQNLWRKKGIDSKQLEEIFRLSGGAILREISRFCVKNYDELKKNGLTRDDVTSKSVDILMNCVKEWHTRNSVDSQEGDASFISYLIGSLSRSLFSSLLGPYRAKKRTGDVVSIENEKGDEVIADQKSGFNFVERSLAAEDLRVFLFDQRNNPLNVLEIILYYGLGKSFFDSWQKFYLEENPDLRQKFAKDFVWIDKINLEELKKENIDSPWNLKEIGDLMGVTREAVEPRVNGLIEKFKLRAKFKK